MNKKNNKTIVTASLLLSIMLSTATFASENVSKWVGVIQEEGGYHTPNHSKGHDLEFVRQADNESFDVVDSPELLKLHASKDKNLLVEIEGEITSQFLFWGGNLIIKDFKVLKELDVVEHKEAPVKQMSYNRERNPGNR